MRAPDTVQLSTPSFGLAKPGRIGLSKPGPLGLVKPGKLSSRSASGKSLEVKQTWVTTPAIWNVTGDDLEMAPIDFPLERTSRTIEGADATLVAKRITDTLREHSIEAEYVSKPCKAKCQTNDFVSFRIRLYAGGESGLPVIVEIQRRSGSASCFMQSCRAILAEAEGTPAVETRRKTPPFAMKPIGQMKCLQSTTLPPLSTASAADDSLSQAVAMIRSMKKDTNLLGLESLLALIDPIKTCPSVAMAIAKVVVLGDEKHDIREEIRAFTDRDVYGEEADEEGHLANHADRLRRTSLAIFSNGLSLCARDGCLGAALDKQAWFKEQFMESLVDELKLYETNSCSASQAASCICSLVDSSAPARRHLDSHGVGPALQEAHAYGKVCNDLLAEETGRCLKTLGL